MRDAPPIQFLSGGLGTTLEDVHHVNFSSATTPLWSSHLLLTDQATLLACLESFADAGADVITTATYQVSAVGFEATRTPEWPRGVSLPNIGQFLEDAVLLTSEACRRHGGEVALSLGPYGATMIPSTEYSGAYDTEHADSGALVSWHFSRLLLFSKVSGLMARVRYIALETIPRLDEIIALRRVFDSYCGAFQGQSHRVWFSCLFPGDGETLPDGTSVEDVVHAMLSCEISPRSPWGIGINCTKVAKLPALVKRYESSVQNLVDVGLVAEWPSLVLYPDGTNGEVYNPETKLWELPDGVEAPRESWETQFAAVVASASKGKWRSILVGGCCKTTPNHIRRLRSVILNLREYQEEDEGQEAIVEGPLSDNATG